MAGAPSPNRSRVMGWPTCGSSPCPWPRGWLRRWKRPRSSGKARGLRRGPSTPCAFTTTRWHTWRWGARTSGWPPRSSPGPPASSTRTRPAGRTRSSRCSARTARTTAPRSTWAGSTWPRRSLISRGGLPTPMRSRPCRCASLLLRAASAPRRAAAAAASHARPSRSRRGCGSSLKRGPGSRGSGRCCGPQRSRRAASPRWTSARPRTRTSAASCLRAAAGP
mmetsp:Transcript_10489/g.29673  ORF Transcript_10489/g.29673 Transcript_10489/m.29673 type:complete len:222 (+) Transcript_10489:934-1599(+)